MPAEILLFGFLVSFSIFLIGSMFFRRAKSPSTRLFAQATAEAAARKRQKIQISTQLNKRIHSLLGFTKDPAKAKDMKKKLIMAGHYGERALAIFGALKLGLPLALPLLVLPLLLLMRVPKSNVAIFLYISVALGFFLPNLILKTQIDSRQKKIETGLPDALDLLVVCVEAGLGLDQAIKRVAEDAMISNPVLGKEFLMVNLEINAGLDREQALRNLAERTGVEDLSSLCAILIQADRFGTSVAQALRVQSDTMRTNRRQKLEEKAAKTPVKLVFPLLLFIFPALMVVIIGPGIISIMEKIIKK